MRLTSDQQRLSEQWYDRLVAEELARNPLRPDGPPSLPFEACRRVVALAEVFATILNLPITME
jgi:hypothetical protein